MYQVLYCLTDQHDWRLVALGGAVCLLASAAAISLFHRARARRGELGRVWPGSRWMPSSADAASGRRISSRCWPTGRGRGGAYNIPVTVLSLIFAIAGHLHRAEHRGLGRARTPWIALGGAIVGGGVAAMHYTGMVALEIPRASAGRQARLTVSVLFGIVFAALALFVAARRDDLSDALERDRPADARHRRASFHRHGRGGADAGSRRS